MLLRCRPPMSTRLLAAGPRSAAPGAGAEAWSLAFRTVEPSAAVSRLSGASLQALGFGRPPSSNSSRGARIPQQQTSACRCLMLAHASEFTRPSCQASASHRDCSSSSHSADFPRGSYGHEQRCLPRPLASLAVLRWPPQARLHPLHPPGRARLTTAASSADTGAVDEGSKPVLVIYSKAGCCLCDALKEKIDVVLQQEQQRDTEGSSGSSSLGYVVADSIESASAGSPSPLAGLQVEVRDITSNPEWMQQYEFEIPVMARVRKMADGSAEEVVIPRQSPRVSADRLKKVLLSVFSG